MVMLIRERKSMAWALVISGALGFVSHAVLAQDDLGDGASPTVAPRVSSRSSKKISMVSDTLKDILQSVQNEEKAETAIYNKYQTWCAAETASIDEDLSQTKTALANAKVLSEEQASTDDALKLFIKKSKKESEETKDAMQQAEALRKEENDEYTEEMTTNTQSLRQIDAAIKHVGKVEKEGGFLQGGVLKKLQINEAGEPSYVYGVMKGLRDQLKKTRAELQSVEKDKVTGYDDFMTVKKGAEKVLGDTTTEKNIALTEIIGAAEGTKRKIAKLSNEVSELQAREAKTAENCKSTQEEWKVRQADRKQEKAALKEAIRFLTDISLEQLSSVKHRQEDPADEEHASVVFAPSFDGATSFLQDASSAKLSDNEFFTEASAELLGEDDEIEGHMRKDTFNGVKSVVTKLISSHQENQKDERSKREYCEKEIEAKDDEKADTANALAAVKANIDKKSTQVDTLTDEIKMLNAAQVAIRKSVKDAGAVRKEEHAVYTSGSKDRALAVKVLNQAITVLQQQFKKKSALLQQKKLKGAPAGLPPAKSKTAASFGVMSMIQDIIDDISKEQRDVTIAEENAKVAFAQLQKDSQESWDDKQQDITDRIRSKAKLGVDIGTLKETQTEKSDDLAAIMMQLGSLHKECDELLKSYDKRKKARSFEVSQLRDVMDILSGSTMAIRTGLMQDADAATADGTSAASGK